MRQPTPPAPPAPPAPSAQPGGVPSPATVTAPATAREMYQAARAYRTELRNQLERLEEQRSELRQELGNTGDEAITGAARAAAEARLADVNARIASLDQAVAAADQQVAAAAALPGATVEPVRPRNGPPEEAFIIPIVFIVFVMGPLAAAAAYRLVKHGTIWGKGSSKGPDKAVASAQQAQLERLTHTVDAMAEELERIGEGQRFLTRVLGDSSRSLLAGGAQPLPVAAPEPVPAYRQDEDPARR